MECGSQERFPFVVTQYHVKSWDRRGGDQGGPYCPVWVKLYETTRTPGLGALCENSCITGYEDVALSN